MRHTKPTSGTPLILTNTYLLYVSRLYYYSNTPVVWVFAFKIEVPLLILLLIQYYSQGYGTWYYCYLLKIVQYSIAVPFDNTPHGSTLHYATVLPFTTVITRYYSASCTPQLVHNSTVYSIMYSEYTRNGALHYSLYITVCHVHQKQRTSLQLVHCSMPGTP